MAEAQAPTPVDPALVRLREVAERIRRRVADGPRPAPVPVRRGPPAPPPPQPHWSDGPDHGAEEPSQH